MVLNIRLTSIDEEAEYFIGKGPLVKITVSRQVGWTLVLIGDSAFLHCSRKIAAQTMRLVMLKG